MKDQLKIALMSIIAVAMVVIAINGLRGSGDSSDAAASNSSVAATPASAAVQSSTDASQTFDPLNNKEAIDNTPKTTLKFDSYDHDFGAIKQDTENKKIFTFTNTGKEPLIISEAKGSCGCTVPNYPKAPIAPGGTGEIEVVYKPGKQKDLQNKTVTVIANTEPKETLLRIKAQVEEV